MGLPVISNSVNSIVISVITAVNEKLPQANVTSGGFGFAAFDNAQVRHAYHYDPLYMSFGK